MPPLVLFVVVVSGALGSKRAKAVAISGAFGAGANSGVGVGFNIYDKYQKQEPIDGSVFKDVPIDAPAGFAGGAGSKLLTSTQSISRWKAWLRNTADATVIQAPTAAMGAAIKNKRDGKDIDADTIKNNAAGGAAGLLFGKTVSKFNQKINLNTKHSEAVEAIFGSIGSSVTTRELTEDNRIKSESIKRDIAGDNICLVYVCYS